MGATMKKALFQLATHLTSDGDEGDQKQGLCRLFQFLR